MDFDLLPKFSAQDPGREITLHPQPGQDKQVSAVKLAFWFPFFWSTLSTQCCGVFKMLIPHRNSSDSAEINLSGTCTAKNGASNQALSFSIQN